MTATDDLTTEADGLVRQAVRHVRTEFPDLNLSGDDLYQACITWMLENPGRMALGQLRLPDGRLNPQRTIGDLLRKVLRPTARRERALLYGYEPEDWRKYTPKIMQELIPTIFDKTLVAHPPTRERQEGGSNTDKAHGNTWLAA